MHLFYLVYEKEKDSRVENLSSKVMIKKDQLLQIIFLYWDL